MIFGSIKQAAVGLLLLPMLWRSGNTAQQIKCIAIPRINENELQVELNGFAVLICEQENGNQTVNGWFLEGSAHNERGHEEIRELNVNDTCLLTNDSKCSHYIVTLHPTTLDLNNRNTKVCSIVTNRNNETRKVCDVQGLKIHILVSDMMPITTGSDIFTTNTEPDVSPGLPQSTWVPALVTPTTVLIVLLFISVIINVVLGMCVHHYKCKLTTVKEERINL